MSMDKYGTSEVYTNTKTGAKKEILITDKKPKKNWVRDVKEEAKIAEVLKDPNV